MALSVGSRLGPYEILGLVGAGAMGEVYRARDPRLQREVAVKVLPAEMAGDSARLRRFEQEAVAASHLDHPGILAVHDVGAEAGRPYIVSELLQGETLRTAVRRGRLPVSRAVDYAVQIAHGLAAAHARGIVHRDLKPENLFLTGDGRVKILDFGLAKLLEPEIGPADATGEATDAGAVLGTAAYMAPEQVRAEPTDARADLFSFGCVVHEMLTGRGAFYRATAAESRAAILLEDPPELPPDTPRALGRVVRRCLEKRPADRFDSAHDVALALEAIGLPTVGRGRLPSGASIARPLALAALGGLLALAGLVVGRRTAEVSSPTFRPLTFRRGYVTSARFMPDGQSVVYAATWDGRRSQAFEARVDAPAPRSLDLSGALVVGTSPGHAVVLSGERFSGFPALDGSVGTLSLAPLEGGPSRELVQGVSDAAAGSDGSPRAVVRFERGNSIVEFPVGKRVHETGGNTFDLRLSPDGTRISFVAEEGAKPPRSVMVADSGGTRILSAGWVFIDGLAWSPDGREVWFTGSRQGRNLALYAVDLEGRERLLLRSPGSLWLRDVAGNGQVLLAQGLKRSELVVRGPGKDEQQDVTWLGFSMLGALSNDGGTVLFTEGGRAGSPRDAACLRRLADSAPLALGDGWGLDLSPDGTQALTLVSGEEDHLALVPTRAGEPRTIPLGSVIEHDWAWLFPDGGRILILGREKGGRTRLYVQDLSGGMPKPITEEGVDTTLSHPLSVDGRDVLVATEGGWAIQPVVGGAPRPIPGLTWGSGAPLRLAGDGRSVFVREQGYEWPVRVTKLDLATGTRRPWMELQPRDLAGALPMGANNILLTPDGRRWAYQLHRQLSDLYLVEGLR